MISGLPSKHGDKKTKKKTKRRKRRRRRRKRKWRRLVGWLVGGAFVRDAGPLPPEEAGDPNALRTK